MSNPQNNIKACRTCRHMIDRGRLQPHCNRTKEILEAEIDPVSGEMKPATERTEFCTVERHRSGECKPEGLLYESARVGPDGNFLGNHEIDFEVITIPNDVRPPRATIKPKRVKDIL